MRALRYSTQKPRPWMRGRTYDGWTRPVDYIRVAGDWINTLRPWAMFGTLTFSVDVGQFRADLALMEWTRQVARHSNQHHTVAFASDYQTYGFLHFHFLLAFEHDVDCTPDFFAALEHIWRAAEPNAGWKDFQRFDPTLGAAWYLSTHREIAVVSGCHRPNACRRGRGCRYTSCPA